MISKTVSFCDSTKLREAALFGFTSHSCSRSHRVQRSHSQNWHSAFRYFPCISGETGCKGLIKCSPHKSRGWERRKEGTSCQSSVPLCWPPRTCRDPKTLEAGINMERIQLIFAKRQSKIFIKCKGDLDPCSSMKRKIIRIID